MNDNPGGFLFKGLDKSSVCVESENEVIVPDSDQARNSLSSTAFSGMSNK